MMVNHSHECIPPTTGWFIMENAMKKWMMMMMMMMMMMVDDFEWKIP